MSIFAKSGSHHGFSLPAHSPSERQSSAPKTVRDIYFSVDIETDGPIPGPFSLLSFAIVEAGSLEHGRFARPQAAKSFYIEVKPISEEYEPEAMAVNGLDRERLTHEGTDAGEAMRRASEWITEHAAGGEPVLVAYPLSFDWSWLYWYFVRFTGTSPFRHSRCFDVKTALAVKGKRAIAESGHAHLPPHLRSKHPNTHHALDDAIAQAEVFANLMDWDGP